MNSATKRNSYDAKFKLQVIEFAKNNNNCSAARKYGISEKLVRDWKKAEDTLKEIPKTKKACRGMM